MRPSYGDRHGIKQGVAYGDPYGDRYGVKQGGAYGDPYGGAYGDPLSN